VGKHETQDERTPEALEERELDEANGEPLPDRQAMSLIRGVEPLPLPIMDVGDDSTIPIDDPHPT
jgi:hypothetical protein